MRVAVAIDEVHLELQAAKDEAHSLAVCQRRASSGLGSGWCSGGVNMGSEGGTLGSRWLDDSMRHSVMLHQPGDHLHQRPHLGPLGGVTLHHHLPKLTHARLALGRFVARSLMLFGL